MILLACTGLVMGAVSGRTVEFGIPIESTIAVIPRNTSFEGYKSKYASVGVYAFTTPILMDGMNEKGLVAGAFYFPGFAGYATSAAGKLALTPVAFPNWILATCASIEEVKSQLATVAIVGAVDPNWGDTPPPFHYVVYDKSGASIVIEPVQGTFVVYDNPLGVITNSPTFDWHMQNLRNYLKLSFQNAADVTLKGVELTPFGQGSGSLGMPGDFTPPSRFVRAALYSGVAVSDDPVSQVFHILNQFDIPKGAVETDFTMLTTVKDPKALKYYYRTYDDQTVHVVDLTKFDLKAKSIKTATTQGKGSALDVSMALH